MPVTIAEALALVALGLTAGVLGALVGIGGGVVVVPGLVVLFAFDIRVAIATSLLCVIATSVAAGSVHLGSGLANLRLGLSLEVATTIGAIVGGLVATSVSPSALSMLLGVVLAATVVLLLRGRDDHEVVDEEDEEDALAMQVPGTLAATYRDGHSGQVVTYTPEHVPAGAAVAAGAGALSGMLGVGGGFLKVPAMNLVMRVPLKVAAATSNFMVGITALASLFIYIAHGWFHPYVGVLVATGVMAGALSGTRLQHRSSPAWLRRILAIVLAIIAVQVIAKAGAGA